MDQAGWTTLDDGVWWREYLFAPGAYATTLVFRAPAGLVVISPCCGLDDAGYDAIAAQGDVVALVANNAAHHLGQAGWRARFPQAVSYASPAAMPALRDKVPELRPVDTRVLGERATIDLLDGYRTGDLLVRVRTALGSVWYTGDLLTNIQRLPGPPLRWLFTCTGSAPGLRLFRVGVWFTVADRPALRAHVLRLLDEDPPAVIVPGHGPPVQDTPALRLPRAGGRALR
jgi:glyoxylase-like metal-dependent hydrolase (beta-lactamase superfamily II)